MPKYKVFTVGYIGSKPDKIKALAEKLNAIIVDVRFSPRSRVPHWNQGALQKTLGRRYVYEKGFGNEGYQTGNLKLHNPDRATENVAVLLKRNSVILLCACKDVNTCHRKAAAEYLASRLGVEVEHLTPDWRSEPQATQAPLF